MTVRNPLLPSKLEHYIKEIEPLKQGFDLVNDHVIITDENANIVYANKAMERNTGFSVEEVIGKNPGDLWGGNMPQDFYEKMWQQIKIKKKPFVGEVQNKRKDGQEYWQDLHITPIVDEEGNVKFFIGIELNITEHKQREQFQTEFVGIISHQLQTPLTAIRWTLDWLAKSGGLTEDQRQALADLYAQTRGLINLVGDLLLLSRLGEVQPGKEAIDLVGGVEEIIAAAKKRHPPISFSFNSAEGQFSVIANKSLARQLFSNIIFNAAEYASKAAGKVAVTLSRENTALVFSCEDNGIGIPEKEQEKIFTRFFRASNASQAKERGTGLGLFIVKMIANDFGWNVSFKSKEGEGAAFFVKIPSANASSS